MQGVLRGAVLAAAVTVAASGCAGSEGPYVFAASSLREPLAAAAEGAGVELVFGGSSRLVAQVAEGAPAHVLVTADERTMARAVAAGVVDGEPVVLARNRLVVAVVAGNPERVAGLADLARPGLRVVLAASSVPAGRYADRALRQAGVTVRPVSREPDVRAAAVKVASGEADAALVYATDVRHLHGLEAVPVPDAPAVSYLLAVLEGAGPEARSYAERLLSHEGARALRAAGFEAP
jgi:molybdate transport system substrate-binding protein